jgi:hypothetical protein
MPKKHRQHKHVTLNSKLGLRVGGVVIPYWPSYWGGMSGIGDVQHGQTTTEGAQNDNNGSADAGTGADASGSM